MRIDRVAALALLAGICAHCLPVVAFPNYGNEHPAACKEVWEQRTLERGHCANQAICAVHRNDDRLSKIYCDPYESKADRSLPSITISQGWLGAAGALSEEEMHSVCMRFTTRIDERCSLTVIKRADGDPDYRLLPPQMKSAKLALRADIVEGPFPVTVVRLGIGAGSGGWMEVSWNQNGNGPRTTQSIRLTPAEIDRLLVGLNKSDFWRLPKQYSHRGVLDGKLAQVEVAVTGRQAHVMDAIGDTDAVDLSVLVNAISTIINTHWKNVPA